MPDELHVVSFNLGLLRWKVGPLKLFESPPHVHDRHSHPAAPAPISLLEIQEEQAEWEARAATESLRGLKAQPRGYTTGVEADRAAIARARRRRGGAL